uniref:Microplusin n=1 Tax=Rhipicephalus zambeziensis TaxID=60191 RepID=A0A224YNZ9_9ACAR
MKTFSCLVLVTFLCIHWAQAHELPRTCKLDDNARNVLITCVKETSGTEIMTKLTAVVKGLRCGEDMECGIKKACKEFRGSLEKVGQGIFQKDDVPKIRQLFTACLDKH